MLDSGLREWARLHPTATYWMIMLVLWFIVYRCVMAWANHKRKVMNPNIRVPLPWERNMRNVAIYTADGLLIASVSVDEDNKVIVATVSSGYTVVDDGHDDTQIIKAPALPSNKINEASNA